MVNGGLASMRFKIGLIVIILLGFIAFLLFPFKSALVFYEENTDHIVAFLPLKEGDYFDIIFTHSIHLTDVVEKYHITNESTIMQDEIIFEHFGIGMPSNAEEGQIFEYKDGKYHISNLNNEFESMNIRNGKTVSEHRLRWKRKDMDEEMMVWFNDYFDPGAWFTVQVDRLSLLQYLRGVKIGE
jgi:hypothetical protein